jgi:hypothetical protein
MKPNKADSCEHREYSSDENQVGKSDMGVVEWSVA